MSKKINITRGTRNAVTRSNNNTVNSNSESGIRNVRQNKTTGKWYARTTMAGKQFNLTSFDTPEEASASLKGAEKVRKVLLKEGVLK